MQKDDSADAVAQWEQEAARKAAVARTVQRAVGSVLRRHAQLQGDSMQGCVRHTSRLQQDQVRSTSALVCSSVVV